MNASFRPVFKMNSKVHPLVAVLVLLLTFVAIGVWMWGTGEAKNIGGPAGLQLDADGHLYIQVQNQLIEHDADGAFLKQHDLSRLGAERILGAVAFFSNGDVLLRRGPDPRTLGQNIRAYQRMTNEQSLAPETPDSGLFRCDLEAATCARFGPAGIDFKAAHNIYIDWRFDDVYITDTTRHLLRKYSAAGDAIAEPVAGFKFPNHLLMHENNLYIANTNFHQIRMLAANRASFGEELGSFDVRPPAAVSAGQIWPSHLARVDDEWWVNNMRSDMNDGGIYIFDNEWHFDRTVALPGNADPIALLPFGKEVLISDWNNDVIYRVSRQGELLRDFASPGLEQVLLEAQAKRGQFMAYSYAGVGLFLFVLAGLLFSAMRSKDSNR
jgi:hypothetical protein